MVTQLITAVLFILAAIGLLFIAWLASFIASLFNIKISDLKFDKKRFWNGVYRLVAITLVAMLLAVLFVLIPIVCTAFGVPIPEDFTTALNVLSVGLAFIKGIIHYASQAYDKLLAIIDGGFIEDEDEDEPPPGISTTGSEPSMVVMTKVQK